MSKCFTALFQGSVVSLVGGFHHVSKGYMVEIRFADNSRQSVSFESLIFPDDDAEENAFLGIFSLTAAEAREKGHRKGVPQLKEPKIILIEDISPKRAFYTMDTDAITIAVAVAH